MDCGDVKTITELNNKIKKYELKMRDLIEAYKCVVKEKETLERTVESFSRQKKISNMEGGSEVEILQAELASLSSSIASLTEERRRMERSYLEDKRVMRNEYESNIKAVRSELEAQSIITDEIRTKLKTKKALTTQMEENLIEREYQVSILNEECSRLRVELSVVQQDMSAKKNEHECRVALLEETIGEISRNIGQMEKQHMYDGDTINKLNDRVQSLLGELRLNNKRGDSQSDTPDILQFQEIDKTNVGNNIKAIVERISRLRAQLQAMDPDIDIVSIISQDSTKDKCTVTCTGECEAKINQLTEELECSELKLESVVRTKSSTAYSSYHQQELDRVNEELLVTKTNIANLQEELSNMDALASQKERQLKESMAKIERVHKQELVKLRQEHNQTVSDLQSEITKHRNRTINLLSEKDIELQSLHRIVQMKTSRNMADNQMESSSDPGNDNTDLSTTTTPFDSSCPLYQCCETKARMDQELKRLRQQKRQLEIAVHKLEADNEYACSDLKNEMRTLREKLQRAECISKLESSINMEYLRNVFLRFLTTSDSSCKYLMAKAIGKVLQISANELQSVEKSFQG